MQVNKGLHTCTSWYAYAAMFGSSWMIQAISFIEILGQGGGGAIENKQSMSCAADMRDAV